MRWIRFEQFESMGVEGEAVKHLEISCSENFFLQITLEIVRKNQKYYKTPVPKFPVWPEVWVESRK